MRDELPITRNTLSDLLNDCAAIAAEWTFDGWRCLNAKPRAVVPVGGAYTHTLQFIRKEPK